jgi:O-antigen/teichoic acid export membrane protein
MQDVLNTSFTINFSGPIIYSLLVLSISFFLKDAFDAKALAAFAPVILLLTWLDYAKLLSMATGLYSFRSRLEVQHDILFTLLSVTLIFIGGLYGVIAGLGIATLISVIYALRKLWPFCGFGIDWKVLWDLILTGLPLTANGFLHSLMSTVDKLLIAAMLDRETLGVYGVAFTGVTILTVMPVSLGQMFLVKFAEMEGQNVSKAQSLHVLNRTTTTVSCLFAPIVSAATAYFPVVVAFLLPNFGGAIPSGKYLFASLFFLGLGTPSTNWCMATGRFIPVLSMRLIAIIVEFVAIYLIIHNGGKLEFIALSVLCASAIFTISIITLCSSILGNSIKNGILSIWENLLPFLSILTVILIQNYYFHANIYAPGIPLVIYATLEFVVSLAVSIPLVYWVNRRTQFIELIWPSVRLLLNKVLSLRTG